MIRFITCFLFAITCTMTSMSAQKPRSTLVVRMDDGHPLTVAVNSRYFNKTGTRLTIGDVPGKRPYLQVYRFRPYADGKGGKAERVFSGKIRIERGSTYEVIVHPENRSVSVGELRAVLPRAQASQNLDAGPAAALRPAIGNPAPWLQALLEKMDKKVKDSDKLQLALSGLPESLTSGEAGAICDALLFEDNKLHFLKAAYPKVRDRENFDRIKDCLWEDASRNTLEEWLEDDE